MVTALIVFLAWTVLVGLVGVWLGRATASEAAACPAEPSPEAAPEKP
jgi:hypothetical protein